ncbi:MAG: hypothetical protein WDN46_15150 [Methylocella sp.]
MTVVDFRREAIPKSQNEWRHGEIAELMRLCLKVTGGAADAYAYGETERLDPQFYMITSDPALPSIICVSRISNYGRSWYVVENGRGSLLGEGGDLATLVDDVTGQTRSHGLRMRSKASKLSHLFLTFFKAPHLSVARASEGLLGSTDLLSDRPLGEETEP